MNRAQIEALLPSALRSAVHDVCSRLGIPLAQWPEHLKPVLDVAIRIKAAEVGSLERACEELGVEKPETVRKRLQRYRVP